MGAANMMMLNLALPFSLSTLVIANLHRSGVELSMDDTVASWFGSLPFFCQPIGSIASGFIVQWLGRKRFLMIINIPYFVGCVLISTAPSITTLILANTLLGTTVGLCEAPLNSYFGEICQPSLRSILTGSAAIFYQMGMFTLFVLGSLTSWRTSAGIVAVIPMLTILMLSRVPESPIWLISQGRTKDAEAALCWLRGWVDESAVQFELEKLVKYHETATKKSAQKMEQDTVKNTPLEIQKISNCKRSPELTVLLPCTDVKLSNDQQETNQTTDDNTHLAAVKDRTLITGGESATGMATIVRHKESEFMTAGKEVLMIEDLSPEFAAVGVHDGERRGSKPLAMVRLLLERETLRPLFLTVSFFSLYALGGIPSVRPFLVEVVESFHSPIESSWSTVMMATAAFVGSVVLIGSINKLGKRSLALASTATCALSCVLLGLYGYLFVAPVTTTSGDENILTATWVPLVLLAVLFFANAIQGQIPWLLVAEAFPFRTRGFASGIAAAVSYFISFLAAKTFLSIHHSLQLYGSFWLFGAVNSFCFAFLYFLLPETEGKSLEEIERLFARRTPVTAKR